MRVFLTNLNISQEDAERLVAALPPSQAARAKSLGATVGFHLVRYALRQISPEAAELPWQIRRGGKPCLPAGAPYFNLSHSNHALAWVLAFSDKQCKKGTLQNAEYLFCVLFSLSECLLADLTRYRRPSLVVFYRCKTLRDCTHLFHEAQGEKK